MDLYSSGEDLLVKVRKPYKITKQRERWTEDEHSRFLEALRLYGRAWQRIEEHIGTKTAVQIRSHAQKFFTKLEKEATYKGFPIGHTLDVKIPPPRPKRKPTNPYPRKTGTETSTLHVAVNDKPSNPVSSSCQDTMILDSKKKPERPFDDGKLGNTDRCNEKNDCCEVFTLLCTPSSNAPRNLCTSEEYVLLSKEASNQDETTVSHVTIEANELQKNTTNKELFQDNCSFNKSNVVDSYLSHEKSMCGKSTNDVQASQSYPRHVPVHVLHESLGITAPHNSQESTALTESSSYQIDGVHGHQNPFMNPASSTNTDHHNLNAPISSIHQPFSSYHPIFTQLHNQNAYQTFSSLILSTLLQNPAAHAAASFAATLSPYLNVEAPIEPPIGTAGPFQPKQITLTHNMAAIASATVAAATAWWAVHGLVPFCPPLHPSFNCSPPSAMVVNDERRENSPDPGLRAQKTETDCSKALHEQLSALKSPALSFLNFEESEGVNLNSGLATAEAGQVADEAKLPEASKCENTKQVDRSSCGSNTPSSSEIEGDALEKQENGNEENHMKDSWKEVSQEGRVAFRALFSREVLPQSFSPTKYSADKGNNNNCKDSCILTGQNVEEGLLSLGLSCGHAKVKSNRTGFIPYKRCSVEAKKSRLSVNCLDEEKCAKRPRLELRSST